MKKVKIYELRKNIGRLLEEVYLLKEPVVIYKYNRPIATITPISQNDFENEIDELFGFIKNAESGKEYENKIRRNKREVKRIKLLRKGKYENSG